MKKNSDRCEFSFSLNGRSMKIRVTWEAIVAIQTALGFGIVPLAARINAKNYGLIEATTIIFHGLVAAEPKVAPTEEQVCEQVFKAGLLSDDIIGAMVTFCEYALTGGKPLGEPSADG